MKLQLATILNMLPPEERLERIKELLFSIHNTTTSEKVKVAVNRHLNELKLYETKLNELKLYKTRVRGLNNDYT